MGRLWLLALALTLTGCAFIFGAADVRELTLTTTLPDSIAAVVQAQDRTVALQFVPFEGREEMHVKSPSGRFYVFDFQSALDSLCIDLLSRKFTLADSADDIVVIEVAAVSDRVEGINPHLRDFHYQAGFIVDLRVGEYSKSIAYHDETTVHTPRDAEAALTAMLDRLLLRIMLNIDATLDACELQTEY